MTEEDWRELAEQGRKCQLAWEILEPILSDIHDNAVKSLQISMLDDESLRRENAVIHVIGVISSEIKTVIQRGDIAEEVLANGE